MPIKITLDHLITKEELLGVYRLFCQAYEIQLEGRDEERFLLWHYDRLIQDRNFDHRPSMGAKFFGSKHNFQYEFHGYNNGVDNASKRDKQFQELVAQQFGKSPE